MSGLKARLAAALEPVEAWRADAAPGLGDHDLNPGYVPADQPLRPAAVLIPVIDRAEGPTLLLTRRSDSLASHTGQIAFPGGRLEPGETAVEAALREAFEEVGLPLGDVEPLGLSDSYRTVTGFVVTPVVAWVRPGFTPVLDPGEVADVFEAPFDWLMDSANHRRDVQTFDGHERTYWAMPWGERYIWGATAGMLRALSLRLHPERREDAA